jgi:hypothetical protein
LKEPGCLKQLKKYPYVGNNMLTPMTTANTHRGLAAEGGIAADQAAESKMRRNICIKFNFFSASTRFYVIGPIKRNSINNYDFLKFMISVWGGPRATK